MRMPIDPKGRTTPGFERHAFVCAHERSAGAGRPSCLPKGSIDLMKELKTRTKEKNLEGVRVQKSGCLDHCEFGPTCVIYPEGTWYGLTSEKAMNAVLKHLETGEIQPEFIIRMNE